MPVAINGGYLSKTVMNRNKVADQVNRITDELKKMQQQNAQQGGGQGGAPGGVQGRG